MKPPQTGGISYKKLFKILENPVKCLAKSLMYSYGHPESNVDMFDKIIHVLLWTPRIKCGHV